MGDFPEAHEKGLEYGDNMAEITGDNIAATIAEVAMETASQASTRATVAGDGQGKRQPSYGVVPWANVNGDWYFLMQAGYSHGKYDFKVDPLRGHKESGETSWQTAVRECKEESARLLDFSELEEPGREERDREGKGGLLFHVQIIPSILGPYVTYEPVADSSTPGQATCSAADFRHLCAAFDSNRQLLLQKVNQELEREQPDVKMRKKLEKERDDLNNHVSLVWVRLDDVHEDQMGHPPHIRLADQVQTMVRSLQRSTDTGRRLPPNFSATCKLLSLYEHAQIVTFKAKPESDSDSFESVAISSDIEWQYSTRFLGSDNIEEYLWDRRKRQIELYPQDKTKMIRALKLEYKHADCIISEKLDMHDITQRLDQMYLGGTRSENKWTGSGHQGNGGGSVGKGGSCWGDRSGNHCRISPQQGRQGGNFKTQPCKYWPNCQKGDKCKFAHGEKELRQR